VRSIWRLHGGAAAAEVWWCLTGDGGRVGEGEGDAEAVQRHQRVSLHQPLQRRREPLLPPALHQV
jgi:hypothetical protein